MIQFDDNIPIDVTDIIQQLESNGYEAYIVGGCVRDLLLGIEPKDWDITTNATPQEVKKVFEDEHVIPTGEKYGTVTIMKNHMGYEVTTFRFDGNYTDGRRPDKVSFSNSLIEDLKRRDFTINAMAYNNSKGLIDEFDGLNDLTNKYIKCVGNPYDRFNEDALRIMRCVRFAVRYDFKIEENTLNAMLSLISSLKNVSDERINKEFSEIITKCKSRHMWYTSPIINSIIPELKECIGFNQHNPYHIFNVYDHVMHSIWMSEENLILRLTMLLHDICKPSCFTLDENGIGHFYDHAYKSSEKAKEILTRLRYDNKTTEIVSKLILNHDCNIESRRAIKRMANKIGKEWFNMLIEVKVSDIKSQSPDYFTDRFLSLYKSWEMYQDIKENNEAVSVKDLAINGCDIMATLNIKPSMVVGKILNNCLEKIINEELNNSKEILINYVKTEFSIS